MEDAKNLDTRVIAVELDLAGVKKRYEGFAVKYSVTKTGNGQMNEASISVCNILKSDRDYILSAVVPRMRYRQRKSVSLYVGTEQTGTVRLFTGDITNANPTQPPDIWLEIKAKTGAFARSSLISVASPEKAQLSEIAGQVASNMGVGLDFQATDKLIENYRFTGGAGVQVDKLGQAGLVDAYVDDDRLVVKAEGRALKNKVRKLTKETGMIGIPEITDQGLKVKMLHDNETGVGFRLDVESELNPAANGRWVVVKATYTGESHGQPFYIEAEAIKEGMARLWAM